MATQFYSTLQENAETLIKILAGWIEKIVSTAHEFVKKRVKKKKFKEEMDEKIKADEVEDFLIKYPEIPPQKAEKIRKLAEWHRNVKALENIIENNMYRETSIVVFKNLVRNLEEISPKLSFEESGIKLTLTNTDTMKVIEIENEVYFGAILLRFAAATWTYLAYKKAEELVNTMANDLLYDIDQKKPEYIGLKLKFDIKIDVEFLRHVLQARGPDKQVSDDYNDIIHYYEYVKDISNYYLKAVSYILSTRNSIERVTNQEIDPSLSKEHLDGLALGFKGEAQYWLFSHFPLYAEMIQNIKEEIGDDRDKAKELIMKATKLEEDELKNEVEELFDIIEIYDQYQVGCKGAEVLIERSIKSMIESKEYDMFKSRVDYLKSLKIDVKPKIFVDDPKAIDVMEK